MGHLPVMEVLFAFEHEVNVRDKQGSTPLHKACKRGQDRAAQFLIEKVSLLQSLLFFVVRETQVSLIREQNSTSSPPLERRHST